jgi:hypothetical protein
VAEQLAAPGSLPVCLSAGLEDPGDLAAPIAGN